MKKSQLLGAVCAYLICTSLNAVTLQPGDVLQFSALDSYVEGYWGFDTPTYDNALIDAQDGLIIGTAQPVIPGIDQAWTSVTFGVTGNHRTSSAISVLDGSTLDFGGWIMTIGSEDYPFGLYQDAASYTYDGTNYELDYYWDNSSIGGGYLGSLGISAYHLHLAGTVVPIPAAVWLFSCGLLGLIGIARPRKHQ